MIEHEQISYYQILISLKKGSVVLQKGRLFLPDDPILLFLSLGRDDRNLSICLTLFKEDRDCRGGWSSLKG